jgi:hypothetical protein
MDAAERAAEDGRGVAALERQVAELKRSLLLPCPRCAGAAAAGDGAGAAAGGGVLAGVGAMLEPLTGREPAAPAPPAEDDAQQWEALADTLLLVEPLWTRARGTRLPQLRRGNAALQALPAVEQVRASSRAAEELLGHLERCERLSEAAALADSSLFSLFPFSAGAFSRAAWPAPALPGSGSGPAGAAPAAPPSRGAAVREARRLLVDMTRAQLEQRIETNCYIEELVSRVHAKDATLRSSLGSALDAASSSRPPTPPTPPPRAPEQQQQLQQQQQQPPQQRSVDDFLYEPGVEEDAAEVEL